MALALALSKRWEEACIEFEAAVRADPGDPEAQFQLGKAAQVLGRHAQAELAFRRCVELDGSRIEARARMGAMLAQMGRREDARTALKEALSKDSGNVTALNAIGDLEMAAGAWEEATRHWERSLGAQEAQAETAFKLAFAYESKGRLEDSVPRYQAAHRLNPRRLPVLLALASVLERLGRFSEAAPLLGEAAAQRPGDAPLALRWARALDCDGDVGAAEGALRRVPSGDPLWAEAHAYLGWLHARKGEGAEAEKLFQSALAALGEGAWKDLAEGWLAQHAGRTDVALIFYRRAAGAGATEGESAAWEALAGLLYRRSQLDEALEAYTKLSELKPRHVEVFLRLGSLNLKAGRLDAARKAWERALTIDPGNTLARKNLSVLKG